MLGPIAGGLIVGYFHWRVIFFVNLPIGLVGLYLVYLHLPDYREEHTHPLDIVGLILFGSGIALLSYVLEVFGEHTLSAREILGLLAISARCCSPAMDCTPRSTAFPLLRLSLFRIRTFRAAVSGSFFTRLGIGGIPFLLPLLYQVGLGFTPDSIRPADDAAGDRRHEPEDDHAANSGALWLPRRADFQHRDPRSAHSAFRDHRRWARRSGSSCCRRSASGSSPRCNTPA